MDFTMNMMETTSRGIPASQATPTAMVGGTTYQPHHQTTQIAHQTHTLTLTPTQQHHVASHHQVREAIAAEAVKVHPEIVKEDEGQFTPPPRVASVGSHHERVEKGTDTMDFEPAIKIEIRGSFPGLHGISEKDKNSTVQLHFNTVSEVLHYFSQKTVPQFDAINLLTNPELVRNINPEIVRNHFLYVPNANPQEGTKYSTNGYTATTNSQTQAALQSPSSSIIVSTGAPPASKVIKQERRRGEVPPGTIIHRSVQLEVLPNQFVCWLCGIDLQKSVPFEEHMADQHAINKPYKCDNCGVTFKRKAHLDRHRRIHLPIRPYQCGICGKGFTRNEHVRRHAFTHSGEKPFTCGTCTKTFSRREHLIKHEMSHSKGAQSPVVQSTGIGGQGLLLQATDQNGRILTITSSTPSGSAGSTGNATYEIQPHSSGQSSSSSRQQNNGEPVARPYQCGVCGKAFIRNEHLRRHVLTHSGEKPHVCNHCSKAFSRKEHLTKHLRSHNKNMTPLQQSQVTVQNSPSLQISSGANTLSNQAQVSITNQVTSNSLSTNTANNNQIAHTVAHSIASSHPSSVTHAHLPPGTYLPMFGLLAEVV